MKPNACASLMNLPASPDAPCLTLYQPTHRGFPDNQQDPIRFKNLVRSLETSLAASHPAQKAGALLRPFRELASNERFWLRTLDGLAVFGAPGVFRAIRLHRPMPELAVVAPSFHLKPLLRMVQSADRYEILGLTLKAIRMFAGNRDHVEEIDLGPGVPRTLTDALGTELTEPHLTVASYGTGAGGAAMHHGHHSRREETEIDADRFFRAVDRAVLAHHSRRTRLPLVLAALPEHQARFRALSHNPYLVATGIDGNPDAQSTDGLRERAWDVMQPHYLARLEALVERYHEAQPRQLATDDPVIAAEAAVARRIDTLLVDDQRKLPGRIDPRTGEVSHADRSASDTDDVLDDIAEMVLDADGDVVVVPSDRMPTESGCAAIFRF